MYEFRSRHVRTQSPSVETLCSRQHNDVASQVSTNTLLENKNFKKAAYISLLIKKFYFSIKKNFKNIKNINKIKNEILKHGVKIEYMEIRNKNNFSNKINKFNFKIFISYYLKKIRLIDNF